MAGLNESRSGDADGIVANDQRQRFHHDRRRARDESDHGDFRRHSRLASRPKSSLRRRATLPKTRKLSKPILVRVMQSRPEAAGAALLSASGIQAGYRGVQSDLGREMTIGQGEVVALVGQRRRQDFTFLRTLSGVLPLWKGSVSFDGQELTGNSSHVFVAAGIAHVPGGTTAVRRVDHVEANLGSALYPNRS